MNGEPDGATSPLADLVHAIENAEVIFDDPPNADLLSVRSGDRQVGQDPEHRAPRRHPADEQPRYARPTAAGTSSFSTWPVVHPSSLQDMPVPERKWSVPGWIPDRYVTLLSGDGGTGKSLLAMQLATCAAVGLPFLGIELARRKVLYLSCEDDVEEMHRRQVDINKMMGIDFADLEDTLVWKTPTGDDAMLMGPEKNGKRIVTTALYDNLARYCSDNGVQLVVVDTLADTFGGLELDRQQVTRFVRSLQLIATKTNGAVLLLGHPSVAGMRDGAGISGSTAWRNAVRSVIQLRRPKEEEANGPNARDLRVLEGLKGNYSAAGNEIRIRYFEGAFLLEGEPSGQAVALDEISTEVFITRALNDAIARGLMPSPAKNQPDYAARMLKQFEKLRRLKVDQIGSCVERMLAKGELRVALLGTGHSRRRVLAPADHPPLPNERDPKTGERLS